MGLRERGHDTLRGPPPMGFPYEPAPKSSATEAKDRAGSRTELASMDKPLEISLSYAELAQTRAVDDPTALDHFANLSRVANIIEWIRVEQYDIGPLTFRDCSDLRRVEHTRGAACRRDQGIHRRQPGRNQNLHFVMDAQRKWTVGARGLKHAGLTIASHGSHQPIDHHHVRGATASSHRVGCVDRLVGDWYKWSNVRRAHEHRIVDRLNHREA